MTAQLSHTPVKIPEPVGESQRPRTVHDAMWMAYVFHGLSAADTAAQLNRELRTRETKGSVVSYAHRQGWNKAALNQCPTAPMLPAPRQDPAKSADPAAPRRAPLAELPTMPAPAPRRATRQGPAAFTAPAPKPKAEPIVDLAEYFATGGEPEFGPVRPEHLHHLHCKWPIGTPGTAAFRHCGKRRVPGEPYCRPHCDRAYPSGTSKPGKRR